MPDPILASHRGKLVRLEADGTRIDVATNQPVRDPEEKPQPVAPKRWHDPYR